MKKVLIGIAIVFGVVDIVVLGLLLNNAIANNDLKNYTIEELSNENENLKKQLKTLKQELLKFKEENNEKEIKGNNEPIEEIKN